MCIDCTFKRHMVPAAGGSGLAPIHKAARNSIAAVQEQLSLGADVNCFSTGEFSYGKTAIFFAITRDRDDVVLFLADQGARLCVVNNKGQSVLSLSASHLSAASCAQLIRREKAEEDAAPDGPESAWSNFRKSHSDGAIYGDLDPRFLDRPLLSQSERVVTLKGVEVVNPSTKDSR